MSKKNPGDSVILGIDPGYADMGYGVIAVAGLIRSYRDCGSLQTRSKTPMEERLKTLHDGLSALCTTYKPALLAIEKLFFFKNVTTAIEVAQARGVALLVAAEHRIPVMEFTPLEVKQSLTSYGKADKRQVAHMVKALLGPNVKATNDNALDALAIALAASLKTGLTQRVVPAKKRL